MKARELLSPKIRDWFYVSLWFAFFSGEKSPPGVPWTSAGGYLKRGVPGILNKWHSSLNPGIPRPLWSHLPHILDR